jgi:hypothetical protein
MDTRNALTALLVLSLSGAAQGAAASTVTITVVGESAPGPGEPQQSERFSKTVPLGASGTVLLSNVAGDIVVTGGSGDQVVIDAVKRGRSAEDLKSVEIDVSARDGRVEIVTRYPRHQERRWGNSAEVDYTLTVPRRALVRVKTVSGDVQVSTVDGELRAESVSGNVRVTDARNLEGAVTVSGDVIVKAAGSTGGVTVSSMSGNVAISGLKAASLTGSSISGDITLGDVLSDRVTFKSVSGNIDFAGLLAKAGRYALKSHSGDIVLKVAASVGFEVNASSFSGDIHSDLPLTLRFGGTEGKRKGLSQEIRGTFGDGSAILELNSFSGNIRIVNAGSAKPAAAGKK